MRSLLSLLRTYWRSIGVYLVIGGSAALAEWLVFALLIYELPQTPYWLATFPAFLVATYLNYLLSDRLGFASRGRERRQVIILVYLASAVAFGINLTMTIVAVEWFALPLMPAKVGGTGIAFIFNYAARQFYIFHHEPRWVAVQMSQAGVESRKAPL